MSFFFLRFFIAHPMMPYWEGSIVASMELRIIVAINQVV